MKCPRYKATPAAAMARVAERQLAAKIELGWRVIQHSEDTTYEYILTKT